MFFYCICGRPHHILFFFWGFWPHVLAILVLTAEKQRAKQQNWKNTLRKIIKIDFEKKNQLIYKSMWKIQF
jgi:hypothetical protein